MPRRHSILAALTLMACGTTPPAATPPVNALPIPPGPEAPVVALAPPPPPSTPAEEIAARLAPIDEAVDVALREGKAPGCVVIVGRRDEVLFRRAYGARSLEPVRTPMEVDTVFDLASLTKPIATATSILSLVERGLVVLDEPAAHYVPELGRLGKGSITVRHLLTHTAGLPPDMPLSTYDRGRASSMSHVYDLLPRSTPGTKLVYSDVGFIVLEEIVRRVSGEDLASYSLHHIFEPLKMSDTSFLPGSPTRPRRADRNARRPLDARRGARSARLQARGRRGARRRLLHR